MLRIVFLQANESPDRPGDDARTASWRNHGANYAAVMLPACQPNQPRPRRAKRRALIDSSGCAGHQRQQAFGRPRRIALAALFVTKFRPMLGCSLYSPPDWTRPRLSSLTPSVDQDAGRPRHSADAIATLCESWSVLVRELLWHTRPYQGLTDALMVVSTPAILTEKGVGANAALRTAI